jgi:parallel beta-helix repeat protein
MKSTPATTTVRFALLLLFTLTIFVSSAFGFSGPGEGTQEDPFLIYNCVQLQEMSDDLTAYYALSDNIDCSDTINWNGDLGFEPIGADSDGNRFTGSLVGNHYNITGLFINRTELDFIGLFGVIMEAELYNFTVDGTVIGNAYVGMVVGFVTGTELVTSELIGISGSGEVEGSNANTGGLVGRVHDDATLLISLSHFEGLVSGGLRTGGLIGEASNTQLREVYAYGTVTSDNRWAGGLVGQLKDSFIYDSYANVSVFSSNDEAGGLIGEIRTSFVNNSYAIGTVEGVENVGGFVGRLYDADESEIINSYATGTATGVSKIGGFIGHCEALCTVHNSYAQGNAIGTTRVGGLVGYFNSPQGTITNSSATGNVTGSGNYVGGLIGEMYQGTITTSFATGTVNGNNNVGGLVGYNDEGTVTNSSATGTVNGNSGVGGLVGEKYDGTVTNSSATGNVTGTIRVGGLVGSMSDGTITNSSATGTVTGSGNYVGGLIGLNMDGTISQSYATGSVTGNDDVGGLVGFVIPDSGSAQVNNSYATGAVTGNSRVGGLLGSLADGSILLNSYSTGSVSGNSNVGGLIGQTSGTTTNSFWDTQTSNQSTSDGGTGRTTVQMKNISTFDGWNFDEVWTFVDGENDGFPVLQWQIFEDLGSGIAVDDDFIASSGFRKILNLTANDINAEGFIVGSIVQPANGVVFNNYDGTVTYVANEGFVGIDSFEYELIPEGIFSFDGRFYQYVSESLTWAQARDAAALRTFGGLQGYLVTVTSQEEMDFIIQYIESESWMGANDIDVEGDWRWVTGPEGLESDGLGRLFWTGEGHYGDGDGQAVNDEYNNWADRDENGFPGEPNDSGGEDCAQFYSDGEWNDIPCGFTMSGYIVEYGGFDDDMYTPVGGNASVTVEVSIWDEVYAYEEISSCMVLHSEHTIYNFTANITADRDNCITVTASNVIINGNGFTFDGDDNDYANGIYVVGIQNVTISDLILRDFGNSGDEAAIYFRGTVKSKVINSIITENRHGIQIRDGASDIIVDNNQVVSNNQNGIRVGQDSSQGRFDVYNISVINNNVSDNGGYGVRGTYVNDSHMAENTLLLNGVDAIRMQYGSNIILENNVIDSPSNRGIYVRDMTQLSIINNSVESGSDALYLYSTQSVEVSNNSLRSANNHAVYVRSSENTEIYTNVFYSSDNYGVRIRSSSSSTILHNTFQADRWVRGDSQEIVFNNSNSGNTYYFLNGTPSWEVFDVVDTTNNGYANSGSDRPFDESILGSDLWDGDGQDWHPYTENYVAPEQTQQSQTGGGSVSRGGGIPGSQTHTKESSQIQQGTSQSLRVTDRIVFSATHSSNSALGNHTLTMNGFNTTHARVTIQSDPIRLTLEVNEAQEVDVDGDGVADVIVRYDGIQNGQAVIFIQEIEREVAAEPQAEVTPEVVEPQPSSVEIPQQPVGIVEPKRSNAWIYIVILLLVVLVVIVYLMRKK